MQATTSKRLYVSAFWVLLLTLIPWLYFGVYLHGVAVAEEATARAEYDTARASRGAGIDIDDAARKLAEAGKKVRASTYELRFGLDLKGGASITYRVAAEGGQDQAAVLKDAIAVTRFRVDAMGVGEVNIVESGVDQFTVELPGRGKEEIDRIKDIMGKLGTLEFRIVADQEKTSAESMQKERLKDKYVPTEGYAWYPSKEGREVLLEVPDVKAKNALVAKQGELAAAVKAGKPEAELAPLRSAVADAEKALFEAESKFLWTGDALESAAAIPRQEAARGAYEISFAIIPSRKSAFGDFTGSNINRPMAIVLNRNIETSPTINSKLPGSGVIFSDFKPYTQDQARDMVTVLQSGSLKVKPVEISSFVVGPGLGEDAVRRGQWATGVSLLLVILFMAFFYRGAGWVANLAVFLNLAMTIGALMFLGAALSLPGIAGLLLTLGMAVDANILVNERIREEKNAGKGLLQAVTAGYERAFITIVDSNLTTILTAAILYWIGTGPIKGFALTLILGIVISMFTALYVTRTLFLWGIEKGILTEFRMAPVMMKTDIHWMDLRRKFFAVSIALIVAGTVVFTVRPTADKYDLEFTGGQRVIIAMKAKMSISDLKKVIADAKLEDVNVRTIRPRGTDADKIDLSLESDSFELTARIKDEADGRQFTDRVKAAFAAHLVPNFIEEMRLGEKDKDGLIPVHFAINFETDTVEEPLAKEIVSSAPVLAGAKDLSVKFTPNYPGAKTFLVDGRISPVEGRDPGLIVTEQLTRAVGLHKEVEASEPVPQSDFIGPGVARTLRDQAILAVLLSLVAQIVYLRVRFKDFTYGFAAAIALAHDVLITLGFLAVVDWLGIAHLKINLPVIASFLTLIGYSMNDTIVVFDRIRENLGRSTHPGSDLINGSINQTLARSIRTSMTVWLVAVALFAFNWGAASSLEGFAFVMMIGVLTGTYSSVAIASPLLLFLPVYSKKLRDLGQAVHYGLLASLALGLLLAVTADGAVALVGVVLACAMPAHFLWETLLWLPNKDPDGLVRALETAA